MSGADRNALAAVRATPAKHGRAAFGLHASAKAVFLGPAAAIRLKCALGHRERLLYVEEKSAL